MGYLLPCVGLSLIILINYVETCSCKCQKANRFLNLYSKTLHCPHIPTCQRFTVVPLLLLLLLFSFFLQLKYLEPSLAFHSLLDWYPSHIFVTWFCCSNKSHSLASYSIYGLTLVMIKFVNSASNDSIHWSSLCGMKSQIALILTEFYLQLHKF